MVADGLETATWYLGSECYGIGPAPLINFGGREYRPTSQCFVCPGCTSVWLRIHRPNSPRWGISGRYCDKCGPGYALPYDIEWTRVAPRRILEREILLISRHIKRDFDYDLALIFSNPK